MKKTAFLFAVCIILLASQVSSFAATTPEDISNALKSNPQHPYLFFNEAEKQDLLKLIETDKESSEIYRRLLAEANRLIHTPVDMHAPVEPKHPRYYSDNKAISYVGNYRKAVHTLAFVYQMSGDERFAQKAFEFADALCDLRSWGYRAHEFPIIYSRVWPWNVKDDQVVFHFDIRSGDMGYEMAMAYDWLYPALTKDQRNRIRGGILENVITRVRGNWEYHWWASAYRCNWCGIGLSGMGVAALALINEDPQLVDVVAECYDRMDKHLSEIGVDGGWQEGRGYWAYGVRSSIFFMDALKRMSGGKFDLFENERIQNNPAAFALYGITGYFGDGTGAVVGSPHLLNKLTVETGDGEAAYYRNEFLGAGRDMFDIIWPRSDVKSVEPKQKSRHFRSIDWAVMRTEFMNPEMVTIATKAGLNDDPHHGHLDIGQIILKWQDEYFLTDLGHGKYFYDEKYFDEKRWEYPMASSIGHNVVYVNGETQISAKLKDQPWKEGIGGKILEFRPSSTLDYTLMDNTNAYPKKEMKGWRRHIVLDKPVTTIILDEVKSAKGAEIEARFHSEIATKVEKDYVLIKGKKGTMAVIPVLAQKFELRPGRHAYVPVRKEAKFSWIPYFGTITKAKKGTTVIANIVIPVADADEAAAIAKSAKMKNGSGGAVTVSFTKDGKSKTYDFKGTGDGLVLK